MHKTCRSCHVPPKRPDPTLPLNDCAECHLPDPGSESLYPVFPDRVVTPVVTFDELIPASEQKAWKARLLEDLNGSALDVVPADAGNSLAVTIHVSVKTEAGKTDAGATFYAARATAELGLIRIRTSVESGHAAGKTAEVARKKALAKLGRKVYLALTW